ncbi:hypothetical protein L7842_019480 [Providencia rettgeri]|uniref:hypothetical protein n=1 Tax=Providencia rettgeri TaxID=587 RepID=UPI001EE76734|nr:hypothetical protein [Providencia rettgeri]MCG5293665.1 hypothetical protein [Providencia rettgeri]
MTNNVFILNQYVNFESVNDSDDLIEFESQHIDNNVISIEGDIYRNKTINGFIEILNTELNFD